MTIRIRLSTVLQGKKLSIKANSSFAFHCTYLHISSLFPYVHEGIVYIIEEFFALYPLSFHVQHLWIRLRIRNSTTVAATAADHKFNNLLKSIPDLYRNRAHSSAQRWIWCAPNYKWNESGRRADV